eukprot:488377_1
MSQSYYIHYHTKSKLIHFYYLFSNIVSSYVLSQTQYNFAQHDEYCQTYCSSKLASFHSDADFQQALTIIDNSPAFWSTGLPSAQSVWFGLNDIDNENNWTYTDASAFDFGSTTFGSYPWDTQEPTNFDGNEDCVNFYKDFNYLWNDSPCSQQFRGFCNYCHGKLMKYVLSISTSSFDSAQTWCSNNIGTSLASLHSRADMEEAAALCGTIDTHINCWIGLKEITEDTWLWSDETTVDFGLQGNTYPWGNNEPNSGPGGTEHCVEFRSELQSTWNDINCDSNIPFLCNLPSDICYESNWKAMLQTGSTVFSGQCEMINTHSLLAIIKNKQWLYVNSNFPWIIEYIFAINQIYDSYGEVGITIHHFDSLCDYWYIGIGVDNSKMAYLFMYHYFNNNTYVLIRTNLFTLTYGTYYVLKTELSYTNTEAVFLISINDIVYYENVTLPIALNDLQHSKYIGIENINAGFTAKSLFMSQTPNYVFNEPQFNQTWDTLQCVKTSPTIYPTVNPTDNPTSVTPTYYPTSIPNVTPTFNPTDNPSNAPTTHFPTDSASDNPTSDPTVLPTEKAGQHVEETATTHNAQSEEKAAGSSNILSNLKYIIIGFILLVIVICVFIFIIIRRKRKQKQCHNLEVMQSTSVGQIDANRIELNSLQSNTTTPRGREGNNNMINDEGDIEIMNVETTGAIKNIVDNIGNYIENDIDVDIINEVNTEVQTIGSIENDTHTAGYDTDVHKTQGDLNIAPDEFIVDEDEQSNQYNTEK